MGNVVPSGIVSLSGNVSMCGDSMLWSWVDKASGTSIRLSPLDVVNCGILTVVYILFVVGL